MKARLVAVTATAILAVSAVVAFAAPVLQPGTTTAPHGDRGTCTGCHTYAMPPVVTPPVVTPPVVTRRSSPRRSSPRRSSPRRSSPRRSSRLPTLMATTTAIDDDANKSDHEKKHKAKKSTHKKHHKAKRHAKKSHKHSKRSRD